MGSNDGWHMWVDRGGTFTDVVARAPDGRIHTAKLLSEDPGRYDDAAVAAMKMLTGVSEGPLPVADLRVGTTVATNALLERKGDPVCLAITRGFGDALRLGYQERPDIFARRIVKPAPLYDRLIEIDERLTAQGEVLTPLDGATARAGFAEAFAAGFRSIAIVLMHGYAFPAHEIELAKIAAEIGFTQISVSHHVSALIRLIGRGDTSVVDAYLSPVLRRYVAGLQGALGDDAPSVLFMQSNGGLVDGALFAGKDAILSGPAGGIVGMARTATEAGIDHVIGFDMGGTSTDVSHYAGRYERDSETMVAGARIRTPMMRIHTVAAGGGSICRFDGAKLLVGPESAGSNPGPACYRRGGPLAVTDCNLLLGKIQPDHFPHLFGPNGDEPLARAAVDAHFATLVAEIESATGQRLTPEAAAEGFIAIAVANMVNAIKAISVARGHDVSRYTLACFGGAAGQHACLVADALGMDRVMIHPLAGVLSAYGMGLADRRVLREQTVSLALDADNTAALAMANDRLCESAGAALRDQGIADADIALSGRASLRFLRSDNLIEVPFGDPEAMRASFHEEHRARFGFAADGALVVETIGVEAIAGASAAAGTVVPLPPTSSAPLTEVDAYLAGQAHRLPLYDRSALADGFTAVGPLLVIDPVSTTVVEPGWRLRVDAIGNLMLDRIEARSAMRLADDVVDPVRLEIFNGLFMAIAEEMGAALQSSAASVNIRERLDFSCALFDGDGHLVANAPHMPVHLGSMGDSVQTIIGRRGASADARGMVPGDVYVLNAPYAGGTHLPDVTVIMPVFVGAGEKPDFFVAARGHHADIGGISPGSMPPDSRSLADEGILLDNVLLVDAGHFLEADMRALLGGGAWPARNIDQNIGDLKAQIAACARGAAELRRISADYGVGIVQFYMRAVQDNAEEAVRALLTRLKPGGFTYAMDNGAQVVVDVRIDATARTATIDFTGSSAQLPSNFNAPFAVVRAAVLYVVRTLIDQTIPMNDGCLKPISIIVPEGSMLRPGRDAAVVAGNVETSQVVTDALFGALGAMAGAQGTMNNFTFGNARHQYYETIAGGSGAGPDFDGTDVVQTHMTNSRLTDPEILEARFPVLLESFAVRRGSGGQGAHHGGNGAVRRVRFLEAMQAGMLANRRIVPPFGLVGGAPGAVGVNWIERADGSVEHLSATASAQVGPGDVMVIETPGGGGFGKAG